MGYFLKNDWAFPKTPEGLYKDIDVTFTAQSPGIIKCLTMGVNKKNDCSFYVNH